MTDHNASYYTFTLERFVDSTQTGPSVKVIVATANDDLVKGILELLGRTTTHPMPKNSNEPHD